jgi:hypothetical protein
MQSVSKNKSQITPDEYLDLFEKAMKKLSLAVDKPMGEARTLIYFEQLHTYSIEEIQAAVDQAIHDEEYSQIAPVGKLIRYIEEAREEATRGDFLRQESRVLLEQRPQSREEGKVAAGRALVIISRRISEMEEKEESGRRAKREANKKVLDGQARLMALNSEKEE